MFGDIGKKIKNIFSKMIKHSKREKIAFKKLDEYENLMDEDSDNSYEKITKKIAEAIKDYDNLYLKPNEKSSFNQTEIIQIKLDPTIKSKNEIIKEEIHKDYKKNMEKILQNKVHRKDKHKKNNKYK
jgi:archaellin